MTLATRNGLLVTGTVAAVLGLAAFVAAGSVYLLGQVDAIALPLDLTESWYWARWQVDARAPYHSLMAAAGLALVAAVGVAVCVRLFRRVNSPEIYFVAVFLLSCAVELARILVPLGELFLWPPSVFVIVTRAVLFSRILGSLALFAAGVYAAGADYPRIGTVSLLMAALSFVIVYFVPLDNSVITASFLYSTGAGARIDLLTGFLSVGTLVNYSIGWMRGHHEQSVGLVASICGLVVGRELLLHVAGVVSIAGGLAVLAAAVVIFVLVSRSYYLWG